jgi:predicted DNA-binding transcriptional regulator AlpA
MAIEYDDKLLKDTDVQKLLAVSRTYLWRLRKQGKIKAVRQSGNHNIFYRASVINEYLKSLPDAD